MLAIAHWTGQIPRRPPIPEGCSVNQLIALGSRRKRSKVYWMIAQSEKEVRYGIKVLILSLYSFLFFFLFSHFFLITFRQTFLFQVFFLFFYSFVFLDEKQKQKINSNNNFFPFFCSQFFIILCHLLVLCLSNNPVNG